MAAHRRTATIAVSVVLLVFLITVGATVRVPYVALGPGPTINTLGSVDGRSVVEISGVPTHPTEGHLNLTTVSVADGLTFFDAVGFWLSGDETLTPRDEVYPPNLSNDQVDQQNRQEMGGSQGSATLAALDRLGRAHLTVRVTAGAPAAGKLRDGDQVTAVNGAPVRTPRDLRSAVSGLVPRTSVTFDVIRDGARLSVPVTLGARPDAPTKGYLGVTPEVVPNDPRLKVTFNVGEIGGPSAGLMLSLAIIDKLGPESLTGGKFIAGTGTIDDSGQVGPIGGVTHKTTAARRAGASFFLVPAGNCAEAVADRPAGLSLVRVASLGDAIGSLERIERGESVPHC